MENKNYSQKIFYLSKRVIQKNKWLLLAMTELRRLLVKEQHCLEFCKLIKQRDSLSPTKFSNIYSVRTVLVIILSTSQMCFVFLIQNGIWIIYERRYLASSIELVRNWRDYAHAIKLTCFTSFAMEFMNNFSNSKI